MRRSAVQRSLLERPRFRLLLAGRAVSVLGNAFGPVALAFAVLGTPGATAADLALVVGSQAVTQVVLLLGGGVIGDRYPRHRVLVAGELIAGVGYGLLAGVVLADLRSVPVMVVGAVLSGAGSALLLPALTRVVVDVVDRADLQPANALLRIATHSASVVGLLAAGAVVSAAGPGIALALDAASFALAACLFAALRLDSGASAVGRSGVVADVRAGAAEFRRRPWLPPVVLSAAVVNAGTAATFGVLGPVVADAELGGAVPWSLVLAGYTVGTLTSLAISMRQRPPRPLVWCALLTPALALPAATLATGLAWPVSALSATLAGAALSLFSVLWETTLQSEIPEQLLSRVTSVNYVIALSLKPIALATVGAAMAGSGAGPVGLALAAITVIAGLAPLLSPHCRTLTLEKGTR